jgi:hypothetical protein
MLDGAIPWRKTQRRKALGNLLTVTTVRPIEPALGPLNGSSFSARERESMEENDTTPDCFCWTRFGTESGEAADHILERKEAERTANGGVFIWGIGNPIGPSIRELIRRTPKPEVLFSPIKSLPKPYDVLPPRVGVSSYGETLDGEIYRLPEHSLVTSRYDPLALPSHS